MQRWGKKTKTMKRKPIAASSSVEKTKLVICERINLDKSLFKFLPYYSVQNMCCKVRWHKKKPKKHKYKKNEWNANESEQWKT